MNNMNNVNRTFARGFTLLELLIALVIIGLLVGVVAPNLFRTSVNPK